jgi:hypothetical protein
MGTLASGLAHGAVYPVRVSVERSIENRNRLTTAFRLILALPHLILVGGPAALALSWGTSGDPDAGWGAGGGVLGAVAVVCALISWFAILFTTRHPHGLWNLAAFYLRWRVRAVAYTALLRDEYPPFGDGPYPATLELSPPGADRDRLTVAFRLILAIPHLIAIWALGIAWGITTIVAWFAILFTGRYPEGLYRFGASVFQWNIRVEAYLLLLRDEYPPFALDPA